MIFPGTIRPTNCKPWVITLDPTDLHHGPSPQFTICISATGPLGTVQACLSVFVDPSGVVRTTRGVPLPGAKVVLFRSAQSAGPFTLVPNGSGLMSPANRRNPDKTDSVGHFGWDVVSGYYRVQASHTGCTDPKNKHNKSVLTRTYQVPPPVDNIVLTMSCPDAPKLTRATRIVGKAKVGESLSCDHGNWRNSPISYRYAWKRGSRLLLGASKHTYRVTKADRKQRLRCLVGAANQFGQRSASSRPVKIR